MHIYYKPLKLNEGAIKNAEANIWSHIINICLGKHKKKWWAHNKNHWQIKENWWNTYIYVDIYIYYTIEKKQTMKTYKPHIHWAINDKQWNTIYKKKQWNASEQSMKHDEPRKFIKTWKTNSN